VSKHLVDRGGTIQRRGRRRVGARPG
jgi:hypothetical protein